MKRIVAFSIAVLSVVTCGSLEARANDNIELHRKLYARLAELISVDSGASSLVGSYLVLAPGGGFLLDPDLDPDSDARDRRTLITNFMDVRISESWLLTKENSSMGPIYNRALRYIETPRFSLTEEEEQEYEGLNRDLYRPNGEPTRLLETFENAEVELDNVIVKMENWQKINVGDPIPRTLLREHRNALRKYNVQAQGPLVREKLRRHTELNNKRSLAWISDLQYKYDANYNIRGDYGNVDFYPSYQTWLREDLEWPRIISTSSDFADTQHNRRTSYQGGMSASWGLFRVGGRYSEDRQYTRRETTTSNVRLEFELLQVSLRFPFMETSYLSSGTWMWSDSSGYQGKLISDGDYDPENALEEPVELIPFVPVTLLVARNVTLSADWSRDFSEYYRQQVDAGASFGYGPFSLAGRYQKDESRSYVSATKRGNTITFESPQIIGYFVKMIPKGPWKNEELPWEPEAEDMPKDPLVEQAEQQLRYIEDNGLLPDEEKPE